MRTQRAAIAGFKRMIDARGQGIPDFKACATTLRTVKTASVNDWSAIAGTTARSIRRWRKDLWIYDRVGRRDSFASGMVYGFLEFNDAQKSGHLRLRARRARDDDAGRTSMACPKARS
jgi:2-dehydro-3-deoxygluconokinase